MRSYGRRERCIGDAVECKNVMLEILKIDVVHDETCEANFVNVSHVRDLEQRVAIENLVRSYKPNKIRESDIMMKLGLRNEEPVYQSARRLSVSEKAIVNAQIDQWVVDRIVQPSTSDYGPVVFVRKKDNSFRLCIDYRLINKKSLRTDTRYRWWKTS